MAVKLLQVEVGLYEKEIELDQELVEVAVAVSEPENVEDAVELRRSVVDGEWLPVQVAESEVEKL